MVGEEDLINISISVRCQRCVYIVRSSSYAVMFIYLEENLVVSKIYICISGTLEMQQGNTIKLAKSLFLLISLFHAVCQ